MSLAIGHADNIGAEARVVWVPVRWCYLVSIDFASVLTDRFAEVTG